MEGNRPFTVVEEKKSLWQGNMVFQKIPNKEQQQKKGKKNRAQWEGGCCDGAMTLRLGKKFMLIYRDAIAVKMPWSSLVETSLGVGEVDKNSSTDCLPLLL